MESHNPQKTQNIIKDITTTELSSYQIAYKYNTTRATIGKLGKAHLGDNIFRKKNLQWKSCVLKSESIRLKT